MFVIKEKFIVNIESTQSTNQLCIESGAKIFDEINNNLILINSEAQIYLPYNKTFVYFSVQEKKYITFKKAIENESYILLFEVNKLNNIIFDIKEFVNTEENIITFSPTETAVLYEKMNFLEESLQEDITDLEESIQEDITDLEESLQQCCTSMNININNIDGGYF